MPRERKWIGENYHEAFPTRLRMIMKHRGTTQQELGDYLGKSRQQVGFYCDGSSSPDWETVAMIAQYFNVSSDFLLGIGKRDAKVKDDLYLVLNELGDLMERLDEVSQLVAERIGR